MSGEEAPCCFLCICGWMGYAYKFTCVKARYASSKVKPPDLGLYSDDKISTILAQSKLLLSTLKFTKTPECIISLKDK